MWDGAGSDVGREAASTRMQVARLDGNRLHLSDGPIDLIIWAEGQADQVEAAYLGATRRFARVLDELVAELPTLRNPMDSHADVTGRVAQRMSRAAGEYRDRFLTPMIAVAGSVADEILEEMNRGSSLRRAYVNNGGDIALHLAGDAQLRVGIAEITAGGRLAGHVDVESSMGVRGVATSGMDGRSLSMGIADAVTVLARNAATADTAATLIANDVDVEHPSIERHPASELDADSDLGDRLVVVSRPELPAAALEAAISRGARTAHELVAQGSIVGAYLTCAGHGQAVGPALRIAA